MNDQSLDQNLRCLLSEKGTYSPDVVQHVSTGTCCCINVGSKGELTVDWRTRFRHRSSPSYPVSAVVEVGWEQRECRAWNTQVPEGGNKDLVVHCVKCSREVLKNEDRGERGCSSSVKLLRDSKEGSLSWVACLETRLVRVKKVVLVKIGGELIKKNARLRA